MAVHPETLPIATELIERFEGVEEEAYLDPIGIPTICAGLTVYPNGDPVRLGDHCNKRVCSGYLQTMLGDTYIPALERIPGWERLGPHRQAALLSFAWNLGPGFYGSPGFETISRVLREGAAKPEVYGQMADALALYVKAGSKTLPGLVERRKQEGLIWNHEHDPIMEFVALQDTVLKMAVLDAKYLSDLGKKTYKAGDVITVSKVEEIPQNSHAWLTLAAGQSRWAAFLPHWRAATASPSIKPPAEKVNWDDFAAPVGQYITVGEVLQYDARRKPKSGSAEERAIIQICREFDKIRAAWDGPIGITSGYRPEPINAQVGGVPNSYHTRGMALDIYPIGESLEKFYQWLSKRWSGGFGDGRNKGFIHIDTRNGGKFSSKPEVRPSAVWLY
jgi:GH24 family phage-related lysozyme (muramidase)